MGDNNSTGRAMVAVALFLMGAQAVHWLMTSSNHPDASTFRTVAVWAQAVVGFGGGVWVARRNRTASSSR